MTRMDGGCPEDDDLIGPEVMAKRMLPRNWGICALPLWVVTSVIGTSSATEPRVN
jgi:hypothetical protein